MKVAEFMEGLNEQKVFLAFPKEVNAFFVALNDHVGKNLVALAL